MLTTHVQGHVNAILQPQQRPDIQEAQVGKIVRDVLGPDVHRRKTKHR